MFFWGVSKPSQSPLKAHYSALKVHEKPAEYLP